MQTGQPPWKIVQNFLKRVKMELPFDSVILLLEIYLKYPKSPIQKNLCTPIFIVALFSIAKCWKQSKCPSVNEWIKTPWCIYTTEYCAAERKSKLLPFAIAWMDLESTMLSEISQVVKDKYHMI